MGFLSNGKGTNKLHLGLQVVSLSKEPGMTRPPGPRPPDQGSVFFRSPACAQKLCSPVLQKQGSRHSKALVG